MGCAGSTLGQKKLNLLRKMLEPGFEESLARDTGLQALVRTVFPSVLEERVSKDVLFALLRTEAAPLEERLYSMLAQGGTGVVRLEDVLRALAAAAAGQSLRPRRAAQPPLPPPPPLPASAWVERAPGEGGVNKLHAAFAFEIYDLNNDGRITAEEARVCTVVELVTRTMAGNARTVHSTLRAIGADDQGWLTARGFTLMCTHAPNFMYPAFALQASLVKRGRHAAAALRALQVVLLDLHLDAPVARADWEGVGDTPRTPRGGWEDEDEERPSHAGASPPPWQPAAASAPPLSPAVGAELLARAFRAARLGRTADVEAAITGGGVSPAAAFEPHHATLLHVAAAHGHRALCRRLLLLGAPPRARDALGRSAAEVALAYRHWDTAEQLRAAGVPVSPAADVHAAAEAAAWAASMQREDGRQMVAQEAGSDDEAWRSEQAGPPSAPAWAGSGGDADYERDDSEADAPAWRSRARHRG